MNFQYIIFVWSALLVGSLVNAAWVWPSYITCYKCDTRYGRKDDCHKTEECKAPVGYYAWCKQKIISGLYTYKEIRDPNHRDKTTYVKSCHISQYHNDRDRCEGPFGAQTCYCNDNLCNSEGN